MAIDTRERPEITREALGMGMGTHQYYRQENGWVKPAPIGKVKNGRGMEQQRYENQGWEVLKSYGKFDFAMGGYYLENPLEVLFMRGGALELPVDQIIAEGMHINPPTIPWCKTVMGPEHKGRFGSTMHTTDCFSQRLPVLLPQIDGMDIPVPASCDFCERDDFAVDAARRQHMRVMHKEELNALRSAENLAEAMAKLNPQTQQMVNADKYLCGRCGDGFSAINKLGEHMKLHEEPAE